MTKFDWHSAELSRETALNKDYKTTQNVRRFLRTQCGDDFKLDRPFIKWIKDGNPKTLGDIADAWNNRVI
jgi:hypothetical protein